MKMIARTNRGKYFFTVFAFIWYLILLISNYTNAQSISEIYKLENPHFSLQKKISVALKQSLKNSSITRIWLSYYISKEAETDRFNYFPNHKCTNPNSPMLREAFETFNFARDHINNNIALSNKPSILKNYHSNNCDHFKEIYILMDYYLESGRPKLMQIFTSSLNVRFDFGNKPVYWLGRATQSESVEWLKSVFKHDPEIFLSNQIIDGLSSHPPDQKIYKFLSEVLFNKYENTLKESAIFCLGNYGTRYSDYILSEFISKSNSANLNKKAILAIGQSNSSQALYLLSSIATHDGDVSIRKEAIFSLSQINHQKSLIVLGKIAFKDKNTDIQDFTVFALGQMQHPDAVNILYQLSKRHPNSRVRKKALFWIGKQNQKALR